MRLALFLVVALVSMAAPPADAQVQRTLIRDVRPGPESSAPWRFASLGDTLLFIADSSGAFGPEIWGTDGRDAWRVFTPPDSTIGLPRLLGRLGGTIYFLISGSLWFTDGVTTDTVRAGATSLRRFFPCEGRYPAAVLAERIVFAAGAGCELWAVDADSSWGVTAPQRRRRGSTVAQHVLEHEGYAYVFYGSSEFPRLIARTSGLPDDYEWVFEEPDSTLTSWGMVTQFAGTFLFAAERETTGDELWRWDGVAGPELVVDLAPGPASSTPRAGFVAMNRLFFQAENASTGLELRSYDGSSVTTPFEIAPGPGPPATIVQLGHREAAGVLYFWVRSGTGANDTYTLHSWDGTAHRTITTGLGDDRFHEAGHVVGAANRAWFDGCDMAGVHGASLWQTDGTTASVAIAGSPEVCTGARPFMAMTQADDALIARVQDPVVGIEPFLVRPQGTVDTPDGPSDELVLRVVPNPIQDGGSVVLTLPAAAEVRVELYDLLGRRAATLFVGPLPAGRTTLEVPTLSPGTYLVRAGSTRASMTVID